MHVPSSTALESLEPRRLFAVVSWDGGGDGTHWSDPLNWSNDALPGNADDVILAAGAGPEILLIGQSAEIRSIDVERPLRVRGVTLRVLANADVGSSMALSGVLSCLGPLHVDGTITLGEPTAWGSIRFSTNSATMSGTGEIVVAPGTGGTILLEPPGSPAALTIESGLMIRSLGTGKVGTTSVAAEASIVNHATLIADGAGATLAVGGYPESTDVTTVLENHGPAAANNGALLQFAGNWSSDAAITLNQSHFQTHGLTDGASMNRLVNNQGTVSIKGRVDLQGITQALRLDATTGNYFLDANGTLLNGEVRAFEGAKLVARGGALDAVNSYALVEVSGGRSLVIRGSTVVNHVLQIGSAADGSSGTVRFEENTTIFAGNSDALVVFEGGGGSISPRTPNAQRTLTFAGQLTVDATGGAQGTISAAGAAIVNNGAVLRARGPASKLTVFSACVNLGRFAAEDGGTLLIESLQGNLGANVTLTGTDSLLELRGSYTINQPIEVGPRSFLKLGGNVNRVATINMNGTMLVDYTGQPSPLQTWLSPLITGYANGSWNGAGIRSSTAAADPAKTIGIGEASVLAPSGTFGSVQVDTTTLILHLTVNGDANLDEQVDLQDFNILATNFGATGRIFSQGNFNYDLAGSVDLDDFNVLATHFGLSFGSEQNRDLVSTGKRAGTISAQVLDSLSSDGRIA